MYLYVYIYIYLCVYKYIYIYTHIHFFVYVMLGVSKCFSAAIRDPQTSRRLARTRGSIFPSNPNCGDSLLPIRLVTVVCAAHGENLHRKLENN